MSTACFSGHRPNKLYGYDPYSKGNKRLLNVLRKEIVRHIEEEDVSTFITGMALGIDQWAARIVLALQRKYPHVRLVAALPCRKQYSKWNEQSKKEWQWIIDRCAEVNHVSTEAYTPWCMQKRNEWMVNNSKSIIAVHDGTKGGTKNCIDYAKEQGKTIRVINPKTLEVV
ncbi:SLOG family protein [Halobacillus litoralis]|uniref:SLOG family protein n=1 Tax=Halobacillus litoralis TaxID=45668 RepID=UPI001CD410F4|nr:SLOG family protein [Halobacillus litoralis]MCA1021478.1 DUF1273 domain-containing protein [Halobacillus litoralis]